MTLYLKQYFGALISILKAKGLLKMDLQGDLFFLFPFLEVTNIATTSPYLTDYGNFLSVFFIILSTISLGV